MPCSHEVHVLEAASGLCAMLEALMSFLKWFNVIIRLHYSLSQLLHFCFNSYTLRSILADKDGKVQLAFDLEVVRLLKASTIGIQRKRLKGDSWYCKRICESILATARLWIGKKSITLRWSCDCCRCRLSI